MLAGSCSNKKSNAFSNPDSKTPIDLFDDSRVHTIKFSFYNETFWDSLTHHKDLRDSLELKNYLPCKIMIDGNIIDSIGLRAKGESSYEFYPSMKKSFKIKLNEFQKGQKYNGIKKFSLNNNFKDPTMMREKLSLDVLHELGLPAPRSVYAKVYLNGKYWGLYLLVEEVDKEFVKRNFTNDSIGNLYKGEPFPTLAYEGEEIRPYTKKYMKHTHEKKNDWSDLIELTKTINSNAEDEAYKSSLEKVLAVDNCLKIWAVNNLLVNVDAYNMLLIHNFYLYKNPSDNKFHWINYDYNFSFGAWTPKYKLTEIENFPLLFVNTESRHHPLARKLLIENSYYRDRYLEIVKQLLSTVITKAYLLPKIDKYYHLIKEEVIADQQKMYSLEDFKRNINYAIGDSTDPGAFSPGLKQFVIKRTESAQRQLEAIAKAGESPKLSRGK